MGAGNDFPKLCGSGEIGCARSDDFRRSGWRDAAMVWRWRGEELSEWEAGENQVFGTPVRESLRGGPDVDVHRKGIGQGSGRELHGADPASAVYDGAASDDVVGMKWPQRARSTAGAERDCLETTGVPWLCLHPGTEEHRFTADSRSRRFQRR